MHPTQIAGPIVLFLLMLIVGLELTPSDFRRVPATPRVVIVGTLGQIVLLPAMTWAVVALLGVNPVFGAGAILVAVSPGAGMSNILAALSGANTALSVTLTAVASVLSVVTLPLIAAFGMHVFLGDSMEIEVPVVTLVAQLIFSLLIPIALGMWLRTRHPERAERIAPRLHRIIMVTIGLVVVLAIAFADPDQFHYEGGGTALLAAVVWTACAMVIGWTLAAMMRLDSADRFTFLIEFSARNISIASIVAMSGLGRIDLTFFSGVYFAAGYPMTIATVFWRRRQCGVTGFRRTEP